MISYLAIVAIIPALVSAQVGGCGGVADPSAYCTSLMGPGYTCSGISCVLAPTPTQNRVGGCGGVQDPNGYCTSNASKRFTASE